jgi:hypothetical protein
LRGGASVWPLVIGTGWEHIPPPHMNAEELEKRIDELAREFAKTHDEEVVAELEALRGRVAAMKRRLI